MSVGVIAILCNETSLTCRGSSLEFEWCSLLAIILFVTYYSYFFCPSLAMSKKPNEE